MNTQIVFYASHPAGEEESEESTTTWWLDAWPGFESAALAFSVEAEGLVVSFDGQLTSPAAPRGDTELPLHGFLALPVTTIAAWNQQIDYQARFLELLHSRQPSVIGLFARSLLRHIPTEVIQHNLLNHLQGDTIVITSVLGSPSTQASATQSGLRLPAIALAVETDAPHIAENALLHVSNSLLEYLNNQDHDEGQPIDLEQEMFTDNLGRLNWLPLTKLTPLAEETPLADWLEFSWTVVDRWVIVASHHQLIRDIVRARQGSMDLISTQALFAAILQVQRTGGPPRTVFVAQPHHLTAAIHSWVDYIAEHHAEMADPIWWDTLRQQRRASTVQLGIVPGTASRGVRVTQILPNYPADQHLLPGDVITAVDGETLDPIDPELALRLLIAARKKTDLIVLTVVREKRELEIEIAMPEISAPAEEALPVDMLRRLAGVLGAIESFSYVSWYPKPDLLHAQLDLRIITSTQPN
jgi:hypothetical protein